jgi:hypothetical protein
LANDLEKNGSVSPEPVPADATAEARPAEVPSKESQAPKKKTEARPKADNGGDAKVAPKPENGELPFALESTAAGAPACAAFGAAAVGAGVVLGAV